jgi:hypothetical protein
LPQLTDFEGKRFVLCKDGPCMRLSVQNGVNKSEQTPKQALIGIPNQADCPAVLGAQAVISGKWPGRNAKKPLLSNKAD